VSKLYGVTGSAWKGASAVTEALRAFYAPNGSADRDISMDLDVLRRRSRQLFQNNTFSRAMISSFTTNVVGTGIKVRPTLKQWEILGLTQEEAEKWNRKAQDLFELWAGSKKCDAERKNDFAQLQDLALKTALLGGDCFALGCYNKNLDPFGLNIKLLEGERCQNPLGALDSDALTEGVEVDKNGAPRAYHFTTKPVWSIDEYTDYIDTIRVPAFDSFGNPNVVHIFTSDRTDQRRGVPMLAPVILQLKQQERYQDAELMAAVISACFTAVLENNVPEEAEDLYGNVPESERVEKTDDKYTVDPWQGTRPALEMKPGAVWSLAQGQKISSLNPQRPNVNYQPFVESIFAEAAAACGVSFEVVLRKFNSSYNSVRAAILESRKTYERMRHDFVSDFCQPIYEKWLADAVVSGILDAPGFFENPVKRALWSSCRWVGNAAFLLDPKKETDAIKMQIDEQLIDRDTACAMINGGEYEVVARGHAKELSLRKELGIGEPGSVSKTENFSVSTDDTDESSLQ
jgi:lambda family phage portal protein